MPNPDRRSFTTGLAAFASALGLPGLALAQTSKSTKTGQEPRRFGFEDVMDRARRLAESPYKPRSEKLPSVFAEMDWDKWRRIRFRPEKAILRGRGSRFTVQLFHLGHLFKKPVTINVARKGITSPVPYSTDLFDYGSLKLPKQLPIGLGFAGFRVHYPLNDPQTNDELVSFVGSSYFRWLGRGQKYGLSARGLAIGSGKLDNNEEFPDFQEFWIDSESGDPEVLIIHALLDSPSVAGAFRFELRPGPHSIVDVSVHLFARQTIDAIGMAPLTSMYFLGENDRHLNDRNKYDEFRPELHDSDGLLIHTASREWLWRPLKNPLIQEVQRFEAKDLRGFGLMQRDRKFESYQDIELNYEQRPSYWIEPTNGWGEGVVELIELATKDETADNIVVAFVPKQPLEAGKSMSFKYRMRSLDAGVDLHSLGHAINSFSAPARALGSTEQDKALTRRLMIDFVGGEMGYYRSDVGLVQVDSSALDAQVLRTFIVANPALNGIRVMLDVQFQKDKVGVIRASLKSGAKTLTETWTYAWRFYDF